MTEDEIKALEDDLDAVLDYLDHPPEPGTPEDARFAMLMERVQKAEAVLTAPETDGAPATVPEELKHRLATLRRLTEAEDKPRFLEGDGLGPTLGMDVGRS